MRISIDISEFDDPDFRDWLIVRLKRKTQDFYNKLYMKQQSDGFDRLQITSTDNVPVKLVLYITDNTNQEQAYNKLIKTAELLKRLERIYAEYKGYA